MFDSVGMEMGLLLLRNQLNMEGGLEQREGV